MLHDVMMLAKRTGRIDMQGKIILKYVIKSDALGLNFIIQFGIGSSGRLLSFCEHDNERSLP
jgi:hypothetical protein